MQELTLKNHDDQVLKTVSYGSCETLKSVSTQLSKTEIIVGAKVNAKSGEDLGTKWSHLIDVEFLIADFGDLTQKVHPKTSSWSNHWAFEENHWLNWTYLMIFLN